MNYTLDWKGFVVLIVHLRMKHICKYWLIISEIAKGRKDWSYIWWNSSVFTFVARQISVLRVGSGLDSWQCSLWKAFMISILSCNWLIKIFIQLNHSRDFIYYMTWITWTIFDRNCTEITMHVSRCNHSTSSVLEAIEIWIFIQLNIMVPGLHITYIYQTF